MCLGVAAGLELSSAWRLTGWFAVQCRDEAEGVFGLEKRTQRIPIAKYLKAYAAAKGANQDDPVRSTNP